ncbi:MAG TPA: hypothetical protein VHO67_23410 [Polyangia bacterium]|nr:hypothetical protein [Polyangia bacterium]
MVPDILARKQAAFVLWRPGQTAAPPSLVIGTFSAGPPASLKDERTLTPSTSSRTLPSRSSPRTNGW